jgi:uncharacterized surface protein with fasciclin (FAS1) repeats
MTTTRRRLSAFAVVSALALAGACSSDSTTDTAATSTTARAATSSTAMSPTSAMGGSDTSAPATTDIVDTAIAAGDFTTLVTAVQAADLEETLRGDGPFTVFAPTDAAFEKLPAGTLDGLLADPTALAGILTYHVVPGEVMAADVGGLDGQAVTTVNGATFTVGVQPDGSVTLTDAAGNTATVVTTDITTSNGVIHVIDSVLLPG